MTITKSGDRKLFKSTNENVLTHLNENDEGIPYKWNQNLSKVEHVISIENQTFNNDA